MGFNQRTDFTCINGQDGQNGTNGNDGDPGKYGNIWLVQGTSIPKERLTYRQPISSFTGKTIELIRNDWLTKTGLRDLLASGSNVEGSYQQLETLRGYVGVVWQAKSTIAQIGDPAIGANIDEVGKISLEISGTLEYTLSKQQNKSTISITGGINATRLKQFKFQYFNAKLGAQNFVLQDQGNLLNELKAVTFKVRLYNDDGSSQVINKIYNITPQSKPIAGLDLPQNFYKFDLGTDLSTSLTLGQAMTYGIEIEQITRSGARYQSGMNVKFVVEKTASTTKVDYTSD
jgi:hypothetical protein